MGEKDERDAGDAELLQRAKDGDALAFERFVRIHDPGVRALTARLLDGLWAEDVLQETYLKAYRALPAVRTDTSRLAGWLYRIAYRTAVDELRRIKRRRLVSLDLVSETEARWNTAETEPDEEVVARLDVAAALNSLSVEQRAAVVLVDQLGFDYEAAAEILEVPRGTVASRLRYARATLRHVLAASQGQPEQQDEGKHE